MLYKLGSLAVLAFFLNACGHVQDMEDPKSHKDFSLGVAGVATPQPNRLWSLRRWQT
jgi:hypothetical protein